MPRKKVDRLNMETRNKLIGILRSGDVSLIARRAKLNPTVISDVIRGRRGVSNYPTLPGVLLNYIKEREKQLIIEKEWEKALDQVYQNNPSIEIPSDDDVEFSRLSESKVLAMSRSELMRLIKYRDLDITVGEARELDEDELAERVAEEIFSE
jgi:predicted AlkP superfamily phosphohydrolase/phosphomutase